MEEFIILIGSVLSIVAVVCFFVLCRNVAAINGNVAAIKMGSLKSGNESLLASSKEKWYWHERYLMHTSFGESALAGDAARKMVWFRYQEESKREYSASAKNTEMKKVQEKWQPVIEKAGYTYPVLEEFK